MQNDSLVIANNQDSLIQVILTEQHSLKSSISSIQLMLDGSKEERLVKFVTNDTTFTVITTIAVFALGILIDRVYEWIKNSYRKSVLRQYFIHQANDTVRFYSSVLAQQYTLFYQNTTIETGIPITPPKLLSGLLLRFTELDTHDLYNAFDDKIRLSKIRDHISSIDILEKNVDSYHSIALIKSGNLRDSLTIMTNKYIDYIVQYIEDIRANNPNGFSNDPAYIYLSSKLILYYQQISGTRKLRNFHRTVNREIQNWLVNTNLFRTDPRALQLVEMGKEWAHKYTELKMLSIEIRLEYRRFAYLMNKASHSISTELLRLK